VGRTIASICPSDTNHISITPYAGSAKDEFAIGAEKFLDEAKALKRDMCI